MNNLNDPFYNKNINGSMFIVDNSPPRVGMVIKDNVIIHPGRQLNKVWVIKRIGTDNVNGLAEASQDLWEPFAVADGEVWLRRQEWEKI